MAAFPAQTSSQYNPSPSTPASASNGIASAANALEEFQAGEKEAEEASTSQDTQEVEHSMEWPMTIQALMGRTTVEYSMEWPMTIQALTGRTPKENDVIFTCENVRMTFSELIALEGEALKRKFPIRLQKGKVDIPTSTITVARSSGRKRRLSLESQIHEEVMRRYDMDELSLYSEEHNQYFTRSDGISRAASLAAISTKELHASRLHVLVSSPHRSSAKTI